MTAEPRSLQPAIATEPMVAEELDVLARIGGLDLDVGATAVIANVWRAAQEVRSRLERDVLRPQGISWGGFSLLFNLWIWGPMETRALAVSMSCARPSVSSLCDTLERAGLVRRFGDETDRRLVRVDLTASGRRTIEDLYPRFNAGESQLVSGMSPSDCEQLAGLLRRFLHGVRTTDGLEAA
jgi:MarR family transcriptional regulator, 2-MHQ and catechol-resistance regulon repressor